MLIEAVKGVVVFDPAQHIESLRAARKHHVNIKEETYQSVLDSILMQFTSKRKRAIKRAISDKTSARLSVLPIATCTVTLTCLQVNLEMGWQFVICVTRQTYLQSVMVVEPH